MIKLNKSYKKLAKYYKTALNAYHKDNLNNGLFSDIGYLIIQLRYLRDYKLLTLDYKELVVNDSLNTLCEALNEYDLYNTCINNYFIKNDANLLVPIAGTENLSKTLAMFTEEKHAHWLRFWELVQTNIRGWSTYDTTI